MRPIFLLIPCLLLVGCGSASIHLSSTTPIHAIVTHVDRARDLDSIDVIDESGKSRHLRFQEISEYNSVLIYPLKQGNIPTPCDVMATQIGLNTKLLLYPMDSSPDGTEMAIAIDPNQPEGYQTPQ